MHCSISKVSTRESKTLYEKIKHVSLIRRSEVVHDVYSRINVINENIFGNSLILKLH